MHGQQNIKICLKHVSGVGFNGDYRVDVCVITNGAHIEHLKGM